jgi:hypothetical protein
LRDGNRGCSRREKVPPIHVTTLQWRKRLP